MRENRCCFNTGSPPPAGICHPVLSALSCFDFYTAAQCWGLSACKYMQCSSSCGHYCAGHCTSATADTSAWCTFGRSTRRPQCRPATKRSWCHLEVQSSATRRSWCHQAILSSTTPVQEVSLAQGRLAASWPPEDFAATLRSQCLVFQKRGQLKIERQRQRAVNF